MPRLNTSPHTSAARALLAGLLVLAALPVFTARVAAEETTEAIPVVAQPLAELAVYPQFRAPASVFSDNDSRISAEIGARIIEIPVRVGEVVKKGAVLARLERTDFELTLAREETALQALRARLELADYQLSRARALSRKQAVSEELLKQRESELSNLRAQLAGQEVALTQAKRQLEKCTVRAPFEGIISERLAQVGELASPGSALIQIVDNRHLEVSAQLQAQLTQSLPQAMQPELVTSQRRYPLTLRRIVPVFDPRARTREARLRFSADTALPGSTGELVWRSERPHLPAELLSRRDDQLGVFVVDGEQAKFIPLPQAEEGRPAEVSLPTQAPIITLGRFRLQDGDAIRVKP